AGQTERAIDELTALENEIKATEPGIWDEIKYSVRTRLAFAYMRLGEQQNCCATNGAQSCLIPIQPAAIYTRQDASSRAIRIYEEILRERPDDLKSRWLLNIA